MPVGLLKNYNDTNIKKAYIAMLMICLMARNIGVYSLLPGRIDAVIFSLLSIGGVMILAKDFFSKNLIGRLKKDYLLTLFIACMCVSSVLTIRYGIFKNLKEIVWTSITFFIIYKFNDNESEEENIKTLTKFQNIVVLFFLMMSFFSLITIFLK